jgi:transposase
MIEYKCKLEGINFKSREESYTSKCSSFDLESIIIHENYVGNRLKRGLFITKNGIKLNADVNGSLNIGRKEFGDEFIPTNRGLVLNPIKIKSL